MTMKKDEENSRFPGASGVKRARRVLSRRDFAKTTVAAGAAAAFAMPDAGYAASRSADVKPARAAAANSETSKEWRAGRTIPAEYYYDDEHYKKDERYIAEKFWLLADHASRIPDTGDYFVFKFGLGESVIVLRDESGNIRAFNNVCRHRGSRLCRHDGDPRPEDERLSVRQLGESGNAQVIAAHITPGCTIWAAASSKHTMSTKIST